MANTRSSNLGMGSQLSRDGTTTTHPTDNGRADTIWNGTPIAQASPHAVGLPSNHFENTATGTPTPGTGNLPPAPGASPIATVAVPTGAAAASQGQPVTGSAAGCGGEGADLPGTGLLPAVDLPVGLGGAVPGAVPASPGAGATAANGPAPGRKAPPWLKIRGKGARERANGEWPAWMTGVSRDRGRRTPSPSGPGCPRIDDLRVVSALRNQRKSRRGGVAAAGARAFVAMACASGVPESVFQAPVVAQAKASSWSGRGMECAAMRWVRALLGRHVTPSMVVKAMLARHGKVAKGAGIVVTGETRYSDDGKSRVVSAKAKRQRVAVT